MSSEIPSNTSSLEHLKSEILTRLTKGATQKTVRQELEGKGIRITWVMLIPVPSPCSSAPSTLVTNTYMAFNRKAQLEYQLKRWKYRKNLPNTAWVGISQIQKRRRAAGKDSVVLWNNVRLAPQKVSKETARHDRPTYRRLGGTYEP